MDKPKFVYVTYISATPEKVWNALMDPEMTKDYWARHKNVSDWKVGSEWSHEDCDSGTKDVRVGGISTDPVVTLTVSEPLQCCILQVTAVMKVRGDLNAPAPQ